MKNNKIQAHISKEKKVLLVGIKNRTTLNIIIIIIIIIIILIYIGVWDSLRVPRLILRVLKLTIIKVFSDPEIYETWTGDL